MQNEPKPKTSRFLSKNPALSIVEFRYFLSVRFGMIFALNMQSTIIYYWVYHITNDKLSLGLVGLAEVIPAVCFSLFAGHIVDLNEKRKMLLLCLTGYVALGAGLAALSLPRMEYLTIDTRLHIIYFLVFLGGMIRAFYGPSGFAMSGLVVPRDLYPNATSWSSMAWQMGAVCGPLVAGFLIAGIGITAGMFAVLAVELLLLFPLLKIGVKPVIKKEKEPVLRSLTEGVRFVWNTPALLGAQCLDMFSVLFGGAVALLPVFQKEILMVDETGFGILRAAPGMGALCTMALLAFLPLRTNPGRKLFICVTGFALSIIVFGLSKSFLLSFFALMFSGMFDAVSVVIRGTILQLVTPDHMRGRVSSVNTIFISSSNELGDFESGVMAHWLGAVRAVVTGGCITLGVIGITFFSAPQLRNFTFMTRKEEVRD
ncbi:MFS transporter [Flavobacterium selenitireducens]|uniref:MFS transporter n=1 Tax=Flavobacterium selenitireducens TaxID=2722704 RepID=UPI00168B7688|nr:MFS transporter [Flavobacterium selenitireducens]MBD3583836.1 MFS transporter [Flavobacterium selenitireducens]